MKIKVPNIISLWVEKYYPLLFTIVICVLLYVFRSMPVINYLYISVYDDTFLTAILTALSIIFGFLLTALTTLYQSPSRAVIQSPNQKNPDRKTKCVIKTHLNIKQNVIFGANLKPV